MFFSRFRVGPVLFGVLLALSGWSSAARANTPPVAIAGGPYELPVGGWLVLDGTRSHEPDAGDSIVSYTWDLNNDGVYDNAAFAGAVIPWKNVAALFASPPAVGSSFPISLRITDGSGATNVSTATVKIVAPLGPVKPIGIAASPGVVPGNGANEIKSRSVSDDGRFVVFTSYASDLVLGQIRVGGLNSDDVYLYDRSTQITSLISRAFGSSSDEANNISNLPVISGNGRYIVFSSHATDLTNPPSGGSAFNSSILFIHDRVAGSTVMIGSGIGPSISRDGQFVVFASNSTALVSGQVDTNAASDVFLYNVQAASCRLLSKAAGSSTTTGNAASGIPQISEDGSHVIYRSLASNLVVGQVDPVSGYDVFLFDRLADATRLVSRSSSSAQVTAGGISEPQGINENGRYVVFSSSSAALVAGQVSNTSTDIFVYDRETEAVSLVSRAASSTTAEANNGSLTATISGDGRFVAFESHATDLVTPNVPPTLNNSQVFVHDRQTGITSLASHVADSNIIPMASKSTLSRITADGRRVIFYSAPNVYSYERETVALTKVTRQVPKGWEAGSRLENFAVNTDGTFVSFDSNSPAMVQGQQHYTTQSNLFLWSRGSGKSELVSRSATKSGPLSSPISGYVMSADGRYIAFESAADNLVPGSVDNNSEKDVYLYDRSLGTTQLVSRSFGSALISASGTSSSPSISADGRYVAFVSDGQNLVNGQVAGSGTVVFVFDRVSGTNTMVSKAAGSSVTPSNGKSYAPVISKDGAYIAFIADSSNLVSGQLGGGETKVFLYSRSAGVVDLVSHTVGSTKVGADGKCYDLAISSDGRYVAFSCDANDVVTSPVDYHWPDFPQIYRYDRNTGINTLVSHRFDSLTMPANKESRKPMISDDGAIVVFFSLSTDLKEGFTDQNGSNGRDLYDYTASSGLVKLISSMGPGSTYASLGGSASAYISSDGRYVTFMSWGMAVPSDKAQVFIHDRNNMTTTLVSRIDGTTTQGANGDSQSQGISADGRYIAFFSSASNLRSIPTTVGNSNLFIYDRTDDSVRLASRSYLNPASDANGLSTIASMSSDGRYILFDSTATDLAPNAVGGSYLFANFAAPTITNSPLTKAGTFGTAFSGFTITASTTTTSFYASGLPAGLVLDPTSGIISGTPTQGGSFPVKIYAINTAGTGEATLSLSITLPSLTFAQWRTTMFNSSELADSAISGANADPDHDGVSNLHEYAFGLHPKQENFDGNPIVTTENGALTLTYIRFKNATGTTFLPQVSGNLTTWDSGASFIDQVSVTAIAGTQLEQVVVRDKTPASGFGPRFMRLRVTSQ